ncbi:MAG: hypothetical protein K2J77_06490 [Oscillospiraceae bacterium]|nr:hypothetical protein [Oscillospiraceae bacterium]
MGFVNDLIARMERSTAGSEETARRVLEMSGIKKTDNVLFFGDDLCTPRLIADAGADVMATFGEKFRAEAAEKAGFTVGTDWEHGTPVAEGGWDALWFNGLTEPDGVSGRLERIHDKVKKGGAAVYRTLCWLIDPSLDTKSFVEKRFGRPVQIDAVLREAKALGFAIEDFYIAPKSDWRQGFYEPMKALVQELEGSGELRGDEAQSVAGELKREMDMFELHSEEYSFVYYVLRRK